MATSWHGGHPTGGRQPPASHCAGRRRDWWDMRPAGSLASAAAVLLQPWDRGAPRLSARCPQPVPPVAGQLEAQGEGAYTILSTKVNSGLRTSRRPEAVGGVDGEC